MIDPLLAHQGAPDESIALTLAVIGGWAIWISQDRLRGRVFARIPRPLAWAGLACGIAIVVGAPFVARAFFGPVEQVAGPRPRSTARVEILDPGPGATIEGETFRLAVRLDGGQIVEEASTELRPDTGHLHVTIDDRLLSMSGRLEQELDASGLPPGPHSLTVEYVAADHGPFAPRVADGVNFTVP